MPNTVNSSFEGYLKHVVNLDSERSKTAKSSRDFLLTMITNLSEAGKLPPLYSERHINYGSFERKTKINPLNDIDMMVCMTGGLGHYTEYTNGLFTISMSSGAKLLYSACDNGILNSRKVINLFLGQLSDKDIYNKAEFHRRQESLTLQLKSYEWNFDVVPCFYTDKGYYLIPDGNGNWKKTDPRIDANRINTVENQVKNTYQQAVNPREFIRLMKAWKKKAWGDNIASYPFEQLLLSYLETHPIYSDWQSNVRDALSYLSASIIYPIADPKGIQGDLNPLSYNDKQNLSSLAHQDYSNALCAIRYERMANIANTNHKLAIDVWHQIFGNEFKTYGQFYA